MQHKVFENEEITDTFITIIDYDFKCDKFVKLPVMKEITRSVINDLTFIHYKN